MGQGSTRLILPAVVLLTAAAAVAAPGADPNRRQSLRDSGRAAVSQPQDDVNAIRPLAEKIVKDSGTLHGPLVDLIRVWSYERPAVGVMFFLVGAFCMTLALTILMARIRTDTAHPSILPIYAAVMGVGASAFGAYLFVPAYLQWGRLTREGRETQAIVIGHWEQPSSRKAGPYHCVAYLFVAHLPDGSTRTAACRLESSAWYKRVKIGDELLVRYLPSDLTVGGPVSSCQKHFGPLILLILALGAVGDLALALLLVRRSRGMRMTFRPEGEYKPPGKLIRVLPRTSYLQCLGNGAILFAGGILLFWLALPRANPDLVAPVGGMVMSTVGAGMFVVGVVGYRRRQRLAREGRTAQAVVIGRWRSVCRGRESYYNVAYEFRAERPDGSTVTAARRMSGKELYDRLHLGDEIIVRYLPSNPRVGVPVIESQKADP